MELSELLFDDYSSDDSSGEGSPDQASLVGELPDPLTATRRSRKIETEMDITPMIDITFLLLIFFLVASRIDDNSTVQLPTAKNGLAVTVDDSAVLTVVPHGSGVLVYMGERMDDEMQILAEDEASQNELITDFVERELVADVPKQQVLVRAARGIRYREVARIITAAGMADGAEVYVAVIEE